MYGLLDSRVALFRTLLLSLAMVFAVSANAANYYVGGSVGQVKVDLGSQNAADLTDFIVNDFGWTGTASITSDTRDDTDTAWKLFGGYDFNKYVGLELVYGNFGTVSENIGADINITSGADTLVGATNIKGELDITGWGLNVVGKYPFQNGLAVFAKLGYFFYKADATLTADFNGTVNGTAQTLTESASQDENKSDVVYGLGADYYFASNVGLRVEWERYKIKAFDTNFDTDLFAASVMYRF